MSYFKEIIEWLISPSDDKYWQSTQFMHVFKKYLGYCIPDSFLGVLLPNKELLSIGRQIQFKKKNCNTVLSSVTEYK